MSQNLGKGESADRTLPSQVEKTRLEVRIPKPLADRVYKRARDRRQTLTATVTDLVEIALAIEG